MFKKLEHNTFKIFNRNNVILSCIIFSTTFLKNVFIRLDDNLNKATPFPKHYIQDTTSFPPVIQYALLKFIYIQQTTTCKGNSWITEGGGGIIQKTFSSYNGLCTKTCSFHQSSCQQK